MIFLRGVSGCGKTTLATFLQKSMGIQGVPVHSADDFWGPNYDFDITKLGQAHVWCQQGVRASCSISSKCVIVANTSTREADVNTYKKIADEFGYNFVSLVIENRHGGTDVRDVPEKALDRQVTQLYDSIKLR